jgi:hypothetical protein
MYFILKNIKLKIYFFSLLIILVIFTNSFYNFYAIIKRPYEERLMWNYGFGCEKYSYEFIQNIINKYSENAPISIINFEKMGKLQFLFHKTKINDVRKNLILLNLKDKNELKNYRINLSEYKLIENLDNCYFYKKL